MTGWKIRFVVSRLPDGRAQLSATAHLPRPDVFHTPGVRTGSHGFHEEVLVTGPPKSGETPESAFLWACDKLRKALGGDE